MFWDTQTQDVTNKRTKDIRLNERLKIRDFHAGSLERKKRLRTLKVMQNFKDYACHVNAEETVNMTIVQSSM